MRRERPAAAAGAFLPSPSALFLGSPLTDRGDCLEAHVPILVLEKGFERGARQICDAFHPEVGVEHVVEAPPALLSPGKSTTRPTR